MIRSLNSILDTRMEGKTDYIAAYDPEIDRWINEGGGIKALRVADSHSLRKVNQGHPTRWPWVEGIATVSIN
ncbi:hypothetical protein [Aeoliella sp. SH292]|uniref:hypothetical protein n=1 Tax=Aeoliella sp. SH292 TaxID=3454464 RepID=UPI003F97EAB0